MSNRITLEFLQNLVGKTVKFTQDIENWEDYAEPNMMAVVQKFRFDDAHDLDDTVHRIWFDFTPFEVENHKKQNANYWNPKKPGVADLTAVEAGFYKPIDEMYFGGRKTELPFEVVE